MTIVHQDAFPGGFPVVANPRTAFESRGVTVVEDRAGLARLPFVAALAVHAVLHGVPAGGFARPFPTTRAWASSESR
ncbi:hypothetical protein F0344_05815 [Streptomyces finlayi]|uniref:Uncharacterized protein n=1 Tax=Streptomyces finlayi TaxID=67296 RepID=A0A7G7BFS3_9ACTN|nr:hypothetical protein [Streptomyces finlayi]QNE74188.1 hypothetical protein F0344_05815 [Streptomyces finlayi]